MHAVPACCQSSLNVSENANWSHDHDRMSQKHVHAFPLFEWSPLQAGTHTALGTEIHLTVQLHAKRGVKKAGLLGKNVLLPPLQHPDWLVTPDSLKCDNCIPLTPSSNPLHTHTHEGSSWREGHCAREWKGDVVTCLSKQFKIAIYY